MSDFVWEIVRDVKSGRYRAELTEIEPDFVIFKGPYCKTRFKALLRGKARLDRMLIKAGFNCWGPEPGASV